MVNFLLELNVSQIQNLSSGFVHAYLKSRKPAQNNPTESQSQDDHTNESQDLSQRQNRKKRSERKQDKPWTKKSESHLKLDDKDNNTEPPLRQAKSSLLSQAIPKQEQSAPSEKLVIPNHTSPKGRNAKVKFASTMQFNQGYVTPYTSVAPQKHSEKILQRQGSNSPVHHRLYSNAVEKKQQKNKLMEKL